MTIILDVRLKRIVAFDKDYQYIILKIEDWNGPVFSDKNIIQLLHLNEINMSFYGAEYNNIERGEAEFNIVVLCSIKPHIDQVQV
jgi:hypothetical protein